MLTLLTGLKSSFLALEEINLVIYLSKMFVMLQRAIVIITIQLVIANKVLDVASAVKNFNRHYAIRAVSVITVIRIVKNVIVS